jgi:4-amino-4-deoxy-L-arabinose transferase-like glycosyltransferase|tara:strand:- start:14528 stop:14689 length:162 start_codon:yes stop_codon:yes gene_type:complete
MEWIKERMQEPSSYAALGGVIVGVGVLVSQPIVIVVGMVGGAVGFLLKEKGVI